MNWVEAELIKCAAAQGNDPLARASAIFKDWLTVPKHVVRPGEILSGIARENGVGLEDLMKFNGLSGPLSIRPGQVVRIPPKPAP